MYLLRRNVSYYPTFNRIKYFLCREGKIQREKKTVYIDNIPYYVSLSSGEILRKKKREEVKNSIIASLSRTKNIVKDIVLSNTWDFFVTLTFNNDEQNRMDTNEVYNQYTKWRRSMRYSFKSMKYICVPEIHKNGAVHFHLLVAGVSATELKLSDSGKKHKITGAKIFNINAWSYGFSTAVEINGENAQEKVCNYILKYISKDMNKSNVFHKRYWYSKETCNISVKQDSDVKIKLSFSGGIEEIKTAFAKKYDILDLVNNDLNIDMFKKIEYCDFSQGYCIILDYNKKVEYKNLSRIFDKKVCFI